MDGWTDKTATICSLFREHNKEVPYMLHAKYQPNRPSGSGEEVIRMFFTIFGHDGHREFWIMTCSS